MEDRAIKGVPWTMLAFGSAKLITLLTTVVLARLLEPTDFGLMALALLAFGLFGLIRDLGLGGTVVLRQDYDDRALGTVLTLMLIAAVVVMLLVIATAPLAAALLNDSRITDILMVLSLVSVFSMLGGFYDCLLQRELEFRKRFAGQFAQSASFAATGIGLAAAGVGVWSLVIAQIASMIVYSGILAAVSPRLIRPRFDRDTAKDAFSTGGGFLAQGSLGWLEQNIDYLAVGRLLGTTQLGFYSMAYRLSELTHLGIADPIAKVTFPGFARMHFQGQEVTRAYLAVLRVVALVTAGIGAVLSGAADPFTRALLGSEWLPMIGPLTVLGIWAAFKPLEATTGWLLNSMGSAALLAKVTAVLLVPTAPLLILAATSSTTLVAYVILGQTIVALAARSVLVEREVGVSLSEHVRVLWPIAVAGAFAWIASRGVAEGSEAIAPTPSLVLSAIAGFGAFAAVISLIRPDTVPFALRQVARVLRRQPAAAAGD